MEPKAEFDRYAKNYDELLRDPIRETFALTTDFFHWRKWILIENFIRRHGLSPDKMAWLDVGCGKGELLTLGRSRFARVAGCDPSAEMMRDAAAIEIHQQNLPDSLPFADESFDFATAVCVYHHVNESSRGSLTSEIRRILRPHGMFCMIEHNPLNPITRLIVRRSPVDVGARLLSMQLAKSYTHQAALRFLESEYFLCLPEKFYRRFGNLESRVKALPLGGQYAIFIQR